MSDGFDATQYERPVGNWVCGHACEGKACRIGPSRWGRCQATAECQPVKTGDRWRCTRTKGEGGPCPDGPRPDGSCCRPIPKCQPVRTLRAKRGLVTRWTCAITIGVLLLAFYGRSRWRTISPGAVSMPHASLAFDQAAVKAGLQVDNHCAGCHSAARGGPATWLKAAIAAEPVTVQPPAIDANCLRCHAGYEFHQSNTVAGASCSACHVEHNGGGRMAAPDNRHCLACHGDAGVMRASFERGQQLGLRRAPPAVFQSFSNHPAFHPPADVNTLKFNHQKHLTGDIPLLHGRKLDCADCHQPDPTGTYMQPISFAAHCRACHSLQFDERNPELEVPHGNATAVRAYLRSLPTQYADLAVKKRVPVEPFVTEQMARLREQVRSGEDLERQMFLTTARNGPAGRPKYYGCAYCHEVKAVGGVTAPVMPARWFDQGEFTHAKHRTVSCEKCHDVRRSQETTDVLLPAQSSCVQCHSPAGGVADGCASCHGYHHPLVKGSDSAGTWRTADARRDR